MPAFGTEIFLIFLLLLANGVFAMSEIAVVSARKVRLQQRAERGDQAARRALELANSPSHFLSTVQVGITLVGVLAGAFGGARLAEPLAQWLSRYEWITPYQQPLAFGLVVLVITYFSLIIGELVPKRIALAHPEQLASALAGPMLMLSRIASPVVRFLTMSTELVLRLIPIRKSDAPPITEEEIAVLLQQGTDAGIFEEREQEIVGNVFRLGDRSIASLITPRLRIVWLDLEDLHDEQIVTMRDSKYSRYPVCEGSLDKVAGIVEVKDLWVAHLAGVPLDLRKCLRRPLLVPESVDVLRVLELFHETGVHLAIVLDEHGGVEGLVTLSDVLEALGGEATSGRATDTPAVVQRADGSWLVDGSLPMDEFRDTFELPPASPEERHAYHTVGGFVTANLGRIPAPGDAFDAYGFHIEVVDMDGYRVDKILVRREPVGEPQATPPV